MIIPPDPEKDPAIFSPFASTPSLVPLPSEPEDDLEHPQPTHIRQRASSNHPYRDDLGLGYAGEALPPYERRGDGPAVSPPMRERGRRVTTQPSVSPIVIPTLSSHSHLDSSLSPDDLTPRASSSAVRLPYVDPSSSMASTSKLWESSTPSKSKGKSRWLPQSNISSRWKNWWQKWRKWVFVALALFLAGIGVMIGLLVGLKVGIKTDPVDRGSPWRDLEDGKKANWVTSGESLNITYVPSRDGPRAEDGTIALCPDFIPLNASSPLGRLSTTYTAQLASVATFQYPITNATSMNSTEQSVLPDFMMLARGLGSSGTVEMIGSDAPYEVIASGSEGMMTIDVISLYSGDQDLDSIMRVCAMTRDDGGDTLGIFTPVETDGKVSNAYMLNPMVLPSFHVVIRLPPSVYEKPTRSLLYMPGIDFRLDRMAVRFGDLQNIVDFGTVNVSSGRGGLKAAYMAAENVGVWTGKNAIQGIWNVSESIIVNSTDGALMAEVILANKRSDQSTTINPYRKVNSQVASPSPTLSSMIIGVTNATSIPAPIHTVKTHFTTDTGMVSVAFLHQPPFTALEALIGTSQGDVSVSLHSNYIGPFVVKNIWGQVRLASPAPLWGMDPSDQGRRRSTLMGPVTGSPGGVYATRETNLTSTTLVSGVAYWEDPGKDEAMSIKDVEALNGGEVLVLGAWGDVSLNVDGGSDPEGGNE